ncbi:MAG: helix-turn-helix transcriptional regulator [Micropruina sp.]
MAKHTARLRAPGDFGLAVQQARLARGMTQSQLAAELAVPQSTISEIESGKATIYIRRLLSIARASGLEFTATWDSGVPGPLRTGSRRRTSGVGS